MGRESEVRKREIEIFYYRELNKCIDALANVGCVQEMSFIMDANVPSWMESIVLSDMSGVSTPIIISL